MEDVQSALYESKTWCSKTQAAADSNKTAASAVPKLLENTNCVNIKKNIQRRKSSFVWSYFRPVVDSKAYECIICNGCVSNQTSNLARHLYASHNITKIKGKTALEQHAKNRASRSFIWKYCTRESARHARCHLCNKLLYFGSGNTSNVAKHLWRRHANIIGHIEKRTCNYNMEEECKQSEADSLERKKRKGGSYVWKFCDKLSRHSVRCKLCTKVMSFHGTANVITHLQRRHNIMGKTAIKNASETFMDNGNVNQDSNASESLPENTAATDEQNADTKRRKRSTCSASIVWKYCTRIGRDVVRCSICKKNLSNQGTSNLQRHLHRMHGIALKSRSEPFKNIEHKNEQLNNLNQDFVWLHCSTLDEDNLKCNMCASVFNKNNINDIIAHLTVTHSVSPRKRRNTSLQSYAEMGSSEDEDDDYEGFDNDNIKNEYAADLIDFDDGEMKNEVEIYNDITLQEMNEAEEPFEAILPNPLSSRSSRADSAEPNDKHATDNVNMRGRLNSLNEERVRMEIEYFREKAGFYRMQKYLTALQAKKVRAEIAQITTNKQNGANDAVVDAASMNRACP